MPGAIRFFGSFFIADETGLILPGLFLAKKGLIPTGKTQIIF